jgi:23S rRNA (guanine2445-N2)-methyltransferase / 23S rRNA (guanine2069-N7)-methyltransferase
VRDRQRERSGYSLDPVTSGDLQFLASAPRGLAELLARELKQLGANDVRERSTGVAFSGPLAVAYRACLWSRIANRVFVELAGFEAHGADDFYAAARSIDWSSHIGPGATLACDFSGRHPSITHTHFGALKLKDAIVDSLRDRDGLRPDIELERPSVRVHAHAHGGERITISLDLSGESLHRRGYRGAGGEAPLKENVAAGMLLRSGWPELAAQGAQFLDPMCGSGTIVIEAALIAGDRAPALSRDYFGFTGWRRHDAQLWREILEDAVRRSQAPAPRLVIRGHDKDATAIRAARSNAQRAGVAAFVRFEVKALAQATPATGDDLVAAPAAEGETSAPAAAGENSASAPAAGLLCANPPYGVRLEDHEAARALHRELGAVLRERFRGWQAAVLIGAPDLGMELGIRAYRTHALWNGAIECRLLRIKVEPQSERQPGTLSKGGAQFRDTPGARMFGNRLAKNLKRLQSWAAREGVSCYRLYDADMPEYAFAIDLYRTVDPEASWLHVQEYAAPAEIELDAIRRRRGEAMSTLTDVTGVAPERIRVRLRRRTRRGEQYDKLDERANFHLIEEGGLRFQVNFDDYLDTGLFLDHRLTRQRLRAAAGGKRFLNLFAYTGTATVYAAAGAASATTTVDLSNTYLDWAQRNLALNGLAGRQHAFVHADCREWLERSAREGGRYDLIFLDPPTFSNSKRMEGVLDIERDHATLIDACMRLLAPGGLMVFSTNAQRFRLDPLLAGRLAITDVSAATLPKDFERNPRIHRCFEIRALQ